MTVATYLESQAMNVVERVNSRSAAIANTADSVMNVVRTLRVNAASDAGAQDKAIPYYVSLNSPQAGHYANAPIGAHCLELTVDSTQDPTMYDAKEWILTQYGWEQVLTAEAGSPAYIPLYGGTLTTDGTATVETMTVTGAASGDLAQVWISSPGPIAAVAVLNVSVAAANTLTVTQDAAPFGVTEYSYLVHRAARS